MKLAYKSSIKDRWETITKIKTVSVCEEVIIIKMLDGSIRTLERDKVRYLRLTKLYE